MDARSNPFTKIRPLNSQTSDMQLCSVTENNIKFHKKYPEISLNTQKSVKSHLNLLKISQKLNISHTDNLRRYFTTRASNQPLSPHSNYLITIINFYKINTKALQQHSGII